MPFNLNREKKKINFRVKPKKKINFRVRPKADPIPTDNRAGLELMAKIPYTRGGGIQAHPAQLLDQINLDLFGMRDIDRTARLEANQPSVGGFGKPDEDHNEDDARVGREELSGISEGGDHYWDYYTEGQVILHKPLKTRIQEKEEHII